MSLWMWGVDAVALAIVLVACLMAGLVGRRRWVGGRRTFDLSLNRHGGPVVGRSASHGWVLGMGAYRGDTLHWYRTFSVAWWPSHKFRRDELHILERRTPVGTEVYALDDGDVVVSVRHASGVRQFAMSPSALTGLLAWMESKPPGHDVNTVV